MRTLIAPLALITLPAFAVLNDTGQTQCYDGRAMVACSAANTGDSAAYPGQDGRYGRDPASAAGQYTKVGGGLAGFDFTKICMSGEPAGSGACPADPPIGTGPNDWACTKDNHTNLVWSVDTIGSVTWTEATSTGQAASAYNFTRRCGFNSAWRGPSRRELLSIVDHGKAGAPAIDSGYFPNTNNSNYWGSDAYARGPNYAWSVDFNSGGINVPYKGSPNAVRLVHSGSGAPVLAGFTDNGDGTVTDTATGLMWDKCSWGMTWDSGGNMCIAGISRKTWQQALVVAVAANGQSWRGHSDWRLPSRTELESLVKLDASDTAIDTALFPNTLDGSNTYWSSSAYRPASYPAAAWSVSFNYGSTVADLMTNTGGVRLVRGGQSFADFDAFPPDPTLSVTAPTGGSVSSSPAGIDCGRTCSASFAPGASVTLTATAASGYGFASWSGCDSSNGNICSVSMSANKSVAARFVPAYTLTLSKIDPAGVGTVSSSPAGIDCGSSCNARFDSGVAVTLVAAPASAFIGWGGDCNGSAPTCNLRMSANRTAAAAFAPPGPSPTPVPGMACRASYVIRGQGNTAFTADVQIRNDGAALAGWKVSWEMLNGQQITNLWNGQYVQTGAQVEVVNLDWNKNIPSGSTIDFGFSGSHTGVNTAPASLSVNGVKCSTVASSPRQASLSVVKVGEGVVKSARRRIDCGPVCSASFDVGSTVTLKAKPAQGNEFKGWSGGGCVGKQPCTVTLNKSKTVKATFVKKK